MPLPRFVDLIRVSTTGQARSDTPDDQRRALDALRKHRPGVLVERIEQQISGAADLSRRPDLQRLARLAADRAFDEVRVRHLDRLTRHADPGERSAILAMVYRAGAVIVDASGTVLDPRTMAGELVWVVQTLGAAEERRKIAERTKAGKERLARQGRLVDGRAPWGRRWDGEAWSLNADVDPYRRLFDLALAGHTLREIAARMDGPAPRGGPWTPGIVHHLLCAPHAAGSYRAHGHAIEIPAVVDPTTQARALAALKRHAKGGRTPRIRALLRRLAECECGALIWVRLGADGRHPYYACSKGCPGWHRVDETDAEVQRAVREHLKHWRPGRKPEDLTRDARQEIAEAEKDLKRIDGEEERLARLARRGLLSPKIVTGQLREVAASRQAAQERHRKALAALERASEREGHTETALATIARLRRNLAAWTWQDWRELMEASFPRPGVVIQRDGTVWLTGYLQRAAKGGATKSSSPREPLRDSATVRLLTQRS